MGVYHAKPESAGNKAGRSLVVGRKELLMSRPELASVWEDVDRSFPVQITRSFWEKAQRSDALARQVLPSGDELAADGEGLTDPVGEQDRVPVPWVVHKYPSRALLLLTKRCHLYCRYCFRRTHNPADSLDPSSDELNAALGYLTDASIQEVILSGGDPLAVKNKLLFEVLDRLASIPVRRIHSRAPITAPHCVTPDLVAGLAARGPVWLVVHANHPDELGGDVDRALGDLVNAGIPVLNQSVLLKGVNDNPDTLIALSEALVRRRVFPYYLHHTDNVVGNRHFRVSREQGTAIYREMRSRLSGIALPRYVVDPPTGTGKVDVELEGASLGSIR